MEFDREKFGALMRDRRTWQVIGAILVAVAGVLTVEFSETIISIWNAAVDIIVGA